MLMSIKCFWCRLYLNKKMVCRLPDGIILPCEFQNLSKPFFHSYLMLQFPTKSAQKIAKRSAKKPVRSTGLHILSKNYAKKNDICSSLIFTEFQFHGTGWTQKNRRQPRTDFAKKFLKEPPRKGLKNCYFSIFVCQSSYLAFVRKMQVKFIYSEKVTKFCEIFT